MNIREKAIELYNDSLDINFGDYEDTKEQDLLFLETLLIELGENETRRFLEIYKD